MELRTRCPKCGREIVLFVDFSFDNMPDVTFAECKCGAKPVFSLIYFLEVQLSQYLGDENE